MTGGGWWSSSAFYLKAGAAISVLWAAGHTYGTLAVAYGPERDVLWAQTVQVEGATELFAGMFMGYGALITTFMLIHALFLWHLSAVQRSGRSIRFIAASLAALSLVNTAACATFLIAIPTAFAVVITMCAVLAAALDPHAHGENP